MTDAPDVGFRSPEAGLDSFWLPPNATGNGMDAARWAEIIVVSPAHAEQLLEAFRLSGVPARMAADQRTVVGNQDTHVWVDPDHYAEAENVLLREMSR